MTTGELIRALSHWCPDTTISILTPDGEYSIGALLDPVQADYDLESEVVLTVVEG